MAFCTRCGKPLDASSNFCIYCGNPVAPAAPAYAPAEPVRSPEPAYTAPAEPVYAPEPAYTAPAEPVYAPEPEYVYEAPAAPAAPVAPEAPKGNFANTGLGLMLAGIIFFITLVMGAFSPPFFTGTNIGDIFVSFAIISCMSCGVGFTTPIKGADLSSYAVMAISAGYIGLVAAPIGGVGGIILGVFVSLIICGLIGLVNALIAAKTSAPMALVTLGTGQLALLIFNALHFMITDGMVCVTDVISSRAVIIIISLLIIGGGIGISFAFKSARTPFYLRKKSAKSFANGFPYLLSAIFACFGGLLLCLRASYGMAPSSYNYFAPALFAAIFACISRICDKAAVPMALLGTFIYAFLQNALTILGANSFVQMLIFALLIIILLVLTLAVARKKDIAHFYKNNK